MILNGCTKISITYLKYKKRLVEKGPKVIWDFPRAEVLLKSDPEHITGVDIIAERQQVESCRRGTSRLTGAWACLAVTWGRAPDKGPRQEEALGIQPLTDILRLVNQLRDMFIVINFIWNLNQTIWTALKQH